MADTPSGRDLIDTLRDWCAGIRSQSGSRVRAAVSESSAGDSAFVELESDARIARATVWKTGLCDLEVLAVSTGRQVFYEHHDSVDASKLRALLDELLTRVRT